MKKIILLFLMPFICGFTNPKYNDKPIIIHFQNILNEYRKTNGLCEIVIDESIMELTDIRSRELIKEYNHKEFYKNVLSYPFKFKFAGENIAIVRNIPNDNKPYYSSNIEEIGEIMNKMSMGTSTNYDVAKYCFLKWKFSKTHNDLLLNNEIKRFYLSYDKSRTSYYFCFVALD